MGWSPRDFWNATMGDLVIAVRAQKSRHQLSQQLLAWHVHFVINLVAKNPVRVEDLCPWLRKPVMFDPAMFGGDVARMNAAILARMRHDEEEAALHG